MNKPKYTGPLRADNPDISTGVVLSPLDRRFRGNNGLAFTLSDAHLASIGAMGVAEALFIEDVENDLSDSSPIFTPVMRNQLLSAMVSLTTMINDRLDHAADLMNKEVEHG